MIITNDRDFFYSILGISLGFAHALAPTDKINQILFPIEEAKNQEGKYSDVKFELSTVLHNFLVNFI